MNLLHSLIIKTLPLIPQGVMRRLSARYIAGETLSEALHVLQSNAENGFGGVLDILGEGVSDEAEARAAHAMYKADADALHAAGIDAYISIKPTHLGLAFSPDLALELYADLAQHCGGLDQFIRVEMEDHPTTDATLAVFHKLREAHSNVGIVLQSRLFRTPSDIAALGGSPIDVRMVKGIYLEPPSVAHCEHAAISRAFVECTEQLWAAGHRVALATHDGEMADRCMEIAHAQGVAPDRYEFEVLLGVQQPLWDKWKSAGHKVRVYVPYGPEWRTYSQRRLGKNPEILGHLMRNLLR